MSPTPELQSLVLASYNVHGCVGRDGRFDPERIAAVLAELDADVIALQELWIQREATLERLARATGMHAVEGATLRDERGEYGNALLSRFPATRVEHLDLSLSGLEPRAALEVQLRTDAGPLRVIATHLGLRGRERVAQVQRLLALLEGPGTEPLAVLGDMNEWRPGARALRLLRRQLGRAPAVRTFPARRPLFALDRIWVRPESALTRVRAHSSPAARLASDHLPVRAEVALRRASAITSSGTGS